MFSHLQDVSLSFMDKTEVGRLMSRLQGDVNSMQEFLETSVLRLVISASAVRDRSGNALAKCATGPDDFVSFCRFCSWSVSCGLPRARERFYGGT